MSRLVDAIEVIALVAAAAFVVLLFANEPGDERAAETDTGAAIYADRCAVCHGPSGEGFSAPRLGGGAAVAKFPEITDQIAVVRDGRGGMPAFASRVSAEEIEAVVAYTRDDLSG